MIEEDDQSVEEVDLIQSLEGFTEAVEQWRRPAQRLAVVARMTVFVVAVAVAACVAQALVQLEGVLHSLPSTDARHWLAD